MCDTTSPLSPRCAEHSRPAFAAALDAYLSLRDAPLAALGALSWPEAVMDRSEALRALLARLEGVGEPYAISSEGEAEIRRAAAAAERDMDPGLHRALSRLADWGRCLHDAFDAHAVPAC